MAKLLLLVLSVFYTGAIAYLSLINLAETPVKDLGVSDKLLHAGAYFLLALLWNFYFDIDSHKIAFLRRIVVICSACCAFGIFIEVLQGMLTTYRNLDFHDMLANSLGIIMAGTLFWLLRKGSIWNTVGK